MKIMHVVEATFAGVGRHIIDLARAQADAGHEVIVLYGTVRESDRFRRARERTTHVQWVPIDVSRRPDRSDLKALQKVRSMARGFRPDVVHGHSTKGGMLARSVPPGPWTVVYTPHAVYSMNPELGRSARSGIDLLERRLAARTDIVIAVSPEEDAHLRIMGIEPAKIRMIPNGIPPIERARPDLVRRALDLPLDRPVIGFVGRIDDQKAPHTLLDVFKEVAVARAKVDFVVVGDGKLRSELQARADISPTLAGRVHLVGEQPGPWAMSGMDILILPSRYEGMPYVLIEGAHLGIPMVVTRAAGSSLLQDGPATFRLADVGDTTTLADHCIELVDLWPDRLPSRTDQRFTLDTMARMTELAYEGRPINISREDRGSGTRPVAPRFPDRQSPAIELAAASADETATTEHPAVVVDDAPTLPEAEPIAMPAPPTVPISAVAGLDAALWPPPSSDDLAIDEQGSSEPDVVAPAVFEPQPVPEPEEAAFDDDFGPMTWDPTNPDDDLARHLAWALSAATREEEAAERAWEPPIDGAAEGPQPWDPLADMHIDLTDDGPTPPVAPAAPNRPATEEASEETTDDDALAADDGQPAAPARPRPGRSWDEWCRRSGDAKIIDLRTAAAGSGPDPQPSSTMAVDEAAEADADPHPSEIAASDWPVTFTPDATPPMPGAEARLDAEPDPASQHSATG